MDLISIIVPVYNVEKYLEHCLNSIINQTYKNLEIILVNDGSTDNSLEICESFKQKDSRIKIITKGNGGLSSARNEGLKIAKGNYISFVDSDDWIDADFIKALYNNLISTDSDMSTCEFIRETEPSQFVETKKEKITCYTQSEYMKIFMKIDSQKLFIMLGINYINERF